MPEWDATAAGTKVFAIAPEGAEFNIYTLDMEDGSGHWWISDDLIQLSFEPVTGQTSTSSGSFSVDYIRIQQSP